MLMWRWTLANSGLLCSTGLVFFYFSSLVVVFVASLQRVLLYHVFLLSCTFFFPSVYLPLRLFAASVFFRCVSPVRLFPRVSLSLHLCFHVLYYLSSLYIFSLSTFPLYFTCASFSLCFSRPSFPVRIFLPCVFSRVCRFPCISCSIRGCPPFLPLRPVP